MSNFDIYVVLSAFGAILGDPKFGSFHVGSPHHLAVTGYNELTLVINCMNELCSSSNNTVSKAFWRKKILPQQRISYCAGIYNTRMHSSGMRTICSSSRLSWGGLPQCMLGYQPPGRRPPDQAPGPGTPRTPPPEQTPLIAHTPETRHPPETCCKACRDTTCKACWDTTPNLDKNTPVTT